LLELAGVGFDRVYVHSRAAIPGSVPGCAGALPNPAGVICR
jgi:hypothetical protein